MKHSDDSLPLLSPEAVDSCCGNLAPCEKKVLFLFLKHHWQGSRTLVEKALKGVLEVPSTSRVIVGLKAVGLLVMLRMKTFGLLAPQQCFEAEHFVSLRQRSPSHLGGRCCKAPSCNLDGECRVRDCACMDVVHSVLHCVYSGRAGVVVQQNLLLAQNVPKQFDGVILVKVGNSIGVLSDDVSNGAIAARSKLGVEKGLNNRMIRGGARGADLEQRVYEHSGFPQGSVDIYYPDVHVLNIILLLVQALLRSLKYIHTASIKNIYYLCVCCCT